MNEELAALERALRRAAKDRAEREAALETLRTDLEDSMTATGEAEARVDIERATRQDITRRLLTEQARCPLAPATRGILVIKKQYVIVAHIWRSRPRSIAGQNACLLCTHRSWPASCSYVLPDLDLLRPCYFTLRKPCRSLLCRRRCSRS